MPESPSMPGDARLVSSRCIESGCMRLAISRFILVSFFLVAGMNHFVSPQFYEAIMPAYLPWHRELIFLSGLAEILGAVGVSLGKTRVYAGWGLIALLVAVFPANVHAAVEGIGIRWIPQWILWARLPFQAVLIAWVYWSCRASTLLR